ncbi:TPA: hypothetical protein EYP66_08190 [Candidatus Poribacteria bacterium]|nr:hypothetical protein [Candidatus Poribacteria bacterium]
MPLTVIRTIRPSPEWQESYVRVNKGQRIVIDAEGSWSPDLRNRTGWCGGDGVPNAIAEEGYLMPGTNIGALIAKIGDSKPIAVGARYDNKSQADGVLFFAMNENPNHSNQAGSLMVQIILFD